MNFKGHIPCFVVAFMSFSLGFLVSSLLVGNVRSRRVSRTNILEELSCNCSNIPEFTSQALQTKAQQVDEKNQDLRNEAHKLVVEDVVRKLADAEGKHNRAEAEIAALRKAHSLEIYQLQAQLRTDEAQIEQMKKQLSDAAHANVEKEALKQALAAIGSSVQGAEWAKTASSSQVFKLLEETRALRGKLVVADESVRQLRAALLQTQFAIVARRKEVMVERARLGRREHILESRLDLVHSKLERCEKARVQQDEVVRGQQEMIRDLQSELKEHHRGQERLALEHRRELAELVSQHRKDLAEMKNTDMHIGTGTPAAVVKRELPAPSRTRSLEEQVAYVQLLEQEMGLLKQQAEEARIERDDARREMDEMKMLLQEAQDEASGGRVALMHAQEQAAARESELQQDLHTAQEMAGKGGAGGNDLEHGNERKQLLQELAREKSNSAQLNVLLEQARRLGEEERDRALIMSETMDKMRAENRGLFRSVKVAQNQMAEFERVLVQKQEETNATQRALENCHQELATTRDRGVTLSERQRRAKLALEDTLLVVHEVERRLQKIQIDVHDYIDEVSTTSAATCMHAPIF